MLNRSSCPPDDQIGQRTEPNGGDPLTKSIKGLNWTELNGGDPLGSEG